MKILNADKIRAADAFTISNEPITSINLMERAANAFIDAYMKSYPWHQGVFVFCGHGNNGGDGFAIARIMLNYGYEIRVFVPDTDRPFSADAKVNYERLLDLAPDLITHIPEVSQFPEIPSNTLIIDALFGTGLSRPVEGFMAEIILKINQSGSEVIAVDMPSGLFADITNEGEDAIIKATHTFSFQFPKYSFFLCSNSEYVGNWKILDIGLSSAYILHCETSHFYIDHDMVHQILKKRDKCDHKGIFGHALIWAGSYGKLGAAQLCTHACMNAGAGLTTAYIPSHGYAIFQTNLPEVMVITDADENILTGAPEIKGYSAIGIGPGIGINPKTAVALYEILEQSKDIPLVLDADALNLLSENKENYAKIPEGSILTPHPKEFDRLAGSSENDWERQKKASQFAKKWACILILKGAYTSVNLPDGTVYFNATGNPGMAKGGSGDVLTGIITGLLAQQYSPKEAAILGVYLHGLAGDFAAAARSEWSITARDLMANLGNAFKNILSDLTEPAF